LLLITSFRLAEIIDGKMKVIGQPVLVVVADRVLQFDDEGRGRIERLSQRRSKRQGQQQSQD